MSAMTILQNYPKTETDVESLTSTARKIQQGSIKLEFDNELHTQLASEEVRTLLDEAKKMFTNIDQQSYPPPWRASGDLSQTTTTTTTTTTLPPDIRIPGCLDLSPAEKWRAHHALLNAYPNAVSTNQPIRMGYLVKRGGGEEGFFSRQSLKLRWFVIEHEKLTYYKNFKAYDHKEESLKTPIALKGRVIRVIDKKLLCFEISGLQLSLFYYNIYLYLYMYVIYIDELQNSMNFFFIIKKKKIQSFETGLSALCCQF
ncbi:hypothetical protein RFI_16814 [Reticulomyxa filosa]|uniref:PH domain-containing protein n=1 Tax=Reticulomyxa filosa TaxID=46433 RepID=X6N529_RETFI|nr:hypothetical protein RFI_16814 [Reticulomyxa filosa]|eukprot:ETO20402.1 hypothetical protein RFI_16814 [Reticulomyxa filosa]